MTDDRERVRRGRDAEDRALRHLEKSGYRLVARNLHYRGGELDLVVEKAGTLVFVEVRSRTAIGTFGRAVESVTATKRRRVLHAAKCFLAAHEGPFRVIRFDVIGIDGSGEEATLEHVEDAFDTTRA